MWTGGETCPSLHNKPDWPEDTLSVDLFRLLTHKSHFFILNQMLMFPEGTTTNGSALIKFKPGEYWAVSPFLFFLKCDAAHTRLSAFVPIMYEWVAWEWKEAWREGLGFFWLCTFLKCSSLLLVSQALPTPASSSLFYSVAPSHFSLSTLSLFSSCHQVPSLLESQSNLFCCVTPTSWWVKSGLSTWQCKIGSAHKLILKLLSSRVTEEWIVLNLSCFQGLRKKTLN